MLVATLNEPIELLKRWDEGNNVKQSDRRGGQPFCFICCRLQSTTVVVRMWPVQLLLLLTHCPTCCS